MQYELGSMNLRDGGLNRGPPPSAATALEDEVWTLEQNDFYTFDMLAILSFSLNVSR